MTDAVIKLEALGKRFRIGGPGPSYRTIRESLIDAIRSPLSAFRNRHNSDANSFWALRNLDLSVTPGEVVGLIGRNGAGKSTLLKILASITYPTTGCARVRGRVGSLLEVGCGFHPELSGRENIYLNGAILGMKRAEIHRAFDSIVEFAEIERFLDTAVKHYSSGMYLKLAFSVAAHLDTDILLVDEVLAVGDAQFQQKCLGKVSEVSQSGRTVFFVSHNMQSIMRFCDRVVRLQQGEIIDDGAPAQVVADYLQPGSGVISSQEWPDIRTAPGDDVVRLRSISIEDESGDMTTVVDRNSSFRVHMTYDLLQPGHQITPSLKVISQSGVILFTSLDPSSVCDESRREPGRYSSVVTVPGDFMNVGCYSVLASVFNTKNTHVRHVYENDVIAFQIIENTSGNFLQTFLAHHLSGGALRPALDWKTEGPMEGLTISPRRSA